MANPGSLMQPLRTENLRPRPGAQAQFDPPKQTEMFPVCEPKPLSSPMMTPLASITKPEKTFPTPAIPGEPAMPAPLPAEADDLLETLLQNFTDGSDAEENEPDESDAIPTAQMPQPVFVPIYEELPYRRRRLWPLFLLLMILLLAGAAFAIWKAGLLQGIFP